MSIAAHWDSVHANPIEHEPLKSVYLDKDDDIIEDLHDVWELWEKYCESY